MTDQPAFPAPITLGWPTLHDADGRAYIRCDGMAELLDSMAKAANNEPWLVAFILGREAAALRIRNRPPALDGDAPKETTT